MTRRNRKTHKLRNTAVGGFGALIAAALLWLRLGGGGSFFGTAGGEHARTRTAVAAKSAGAAAGNDGGASVPRCALRIDRSGLSLAGKAVTVEDAVSACRRSGGADLVVTGDANYGLFQRARAALKAAKVKVYVR